MKFKATVTFSHTIEVEADDVSDALSQISDRYAEPAIFVSLCGPVYPYQELNEQKPSEPIAEQWVHKEEPEPLEREWKEVCNLISGLGTHDVHSMGTRGFAHLRAALGALQQAEAQLELASMERAEAINSRELKLF